jgi:glycosyltransferase involved in cell wall biosynthesis
MIIGHFDTDIGAKGGITTYIRRVSEAQKEKGHQIYYFTRSTEMTSMADGVMPIHVSDDNELFTYAKNLKLDILHLHAGLSNPPPENLPVLRTLHGHHPYCPSGSQYLGRWKKPCDRTYSPQGCLWGHLVDGCGSIRPQNILRNFQYTHDEKKSLSNVPIVTVSDFLKQQLIRSGYKEDLIQTLYLFCPDIFDYVEPPDAGIPDFVFLGRLTALKGVEWLLHSIAKVNTPIHMNIAGDGYQESEMKELARSLKIEHQVTFHGWVDAESTKQLIRSARAVIFPSVWHEPGGTVAFEAMAHSRAVIMSRVGGMPEVVEHGLNGLVVNSNDVQALAQSIEKLALDRPLAIQLGIQGREIARENFQLHHHLDKLMKIYEKVSSLSFTSNFPESEVVY